MSRKIGRLKDSAIELIPRQFFFGKEIKNFLPAALPLHHAPLFARAEHNSCGRFVITMSAERGVKAATGRVGIPTAVMRLPTPLRCLSHTSFLSSPSHEEADGGRCAILRSCPAARRRS